MPKPTKAQRRQKRIDMLLARQIILQNKITLLQAAQEATDAELSRLKEATEK